MRLGRAFRSQEDPSARGRVIRDGRACVAWRSGPSGARLGAFGTRPSRLFGPDSLVRHQPANQQTSPTGPTGPTGPTSPTSFHLLRYPSFVDKNRRYVSLPTPRRRRVQKVRSCDLAFCGNAATLLIGQLESGSPIDDFCPREGGLSRGGGSVHVLEPHQKGEQPHTSFPPAPSARSFVRALVPACSYIPAPVPHPRVFGLPSAHNPRLRFFVHPQRSLRALAFSVRPGPVRRMVPSVRPSTRPFTMPQPRFALSQFRLPQVGFPSCSFGSLEPISRRCPYI